MSRSLNKAQIIGNLGSNAVRQLGVVTSATATFCRIFPGLDT